MNLNLSTRFAPCQRPFGVATPHSVCVCVRAVPSFQYLFFIVVVVIVVCRFGVRMVFMSFWQRVKIGFAQPHANNKSLPIFARSANITMDISRYVNVSGIGNHSIMYTFRLGSNLGKLLLTRAVMVQYGQSEHWAEKFVGHANATLKFLIIYQIRN